MVRRIYAGLTVSVVLGLCAQAAQAANAFDIPKLYPKAFKVWRADVPVEDRTLSWLYKLDGEGAPLRPITVGGQVYMTGMACEPNLCADNQMLILVNKDRMFGLAQITEDGDNGQSKVETLFIGGHDDDARVCLEEMMNSADPITEC